MLRIGTFAKLGGVTPKTLRDYDELRILRPAWVDPSTGYRAYSPAQLPGLRRILALRELGVGLQEIARLVSGGVDLSDVLVRRRLELEQERRDVERRLAALDIRVESAATGSDLSDVVVRRLAAESVATLRAAPDADLGPAFYELEAYVRDTGRRASRPPGALVGPSEPGFDPAVEVFVPVRGPIPTTDRIGYRRLAGCLAATIIHNGAYDTLASTRRSLDRWTVAAGFTRIDGLRVLYLQFGAEPELALPRDYLVADDADYVTELQVPIA